MDREVFTDPAVAGFANENFVVYRIDAEKGEGADLAKKHGVDGFPTFLFLDAAGGELERQAGASDKGAFLGLLKDVRAGNHLKGLGERVAKAPEDGALRARLGKKLAQRGDPGAREHLEKAVALDPKDSSEATVESRFYLAILEAQKGQSIDPVAAFARKYPESKAAVDAHRVILNFSRQTGDEAAQEASLEYLARKAPDAEVRNELAWLLATKGRDLERALGLVDEALKETPKSAPFLDTRAECLSRLGRHDEAVEAQRKAVEALPADADPQERAQYEKRLAEFSRKRDEAKVPAK